MSRCPIHKASQGIKVAQQTEQLGYTIYLLSKTEIRPWSGCKKKVVSNH